MKRFNADIGSADATLEKAPEILKAIGVNLAVGVLDGVIHNAMGVLSSESLIGQKEIGVERRSRLNVLANLGLQNLHFPARHHGESDLAAALEDTQDGHFVFGSRSSDPAVTLADMHVSGLTSDEGFIDFNASATIATQLHRGAVLHGLSDAVEHEPCRFLSDAEGAGNFARANATLSSGDDPNGGKPFIQTQRGILEDRPYLRRKLPLGVTALALPFFLGYKVGNILASAGWALNTFRPAMRHYVRKAVIRIREVNDSFLKGLRLFHISIIW